MVDALYELGEVDETGERGLSDVAAVVEDHLLELFYLVFLYYLLPAERRRAYLGLSQLIGYDAAGG